MAETISSTGVRVPTLNFIVLGHDITSNALGRAISMTLVARELGDAELLSFGPGPRWKGASQFDVPVTRLLKDWKATLKQRLVRTPDARNIVWVSKGIAPLDKAVDFVSVQDPSATIILDLDDDDAALAESFAKRSLANRLRLHPWRRGNAKQIRKSQLAISRHADGFTFSTHALSNAYPLSFNPAVRIPHVRTLNPVQIDAHKVDNRGVRFGSFGTLRPHKGSRLLLDLMRHDRSLTLVTFANCGLGAPDATDSNWDELPADMPLNEAYEQIDVAVIPITETGRGAQYQLPAKLIDSLQSCTPVLASPTPAIKEIAHGVFTELNDSASLDEVAQQIRALATGSAGHAGARRFAEVLTPEAAGRELARLLEQQLLSGRPR